MKDFYVSFFQSGETAAHVAARYGHASVIDYLVSADVDINVQDNVSTYGYLYVGCSLCHTVFIWI